MTSMERLQFCFWPAISLCYMQFCLMPYKTLFNRLLGVIEHWAVKTFSPVNNIDPYALLLSRHLIPTITIPHASWGKNYHNEALLSRHDACIMRNHLIIAQHVSRSRKSLQPTITIQKCIKHDKMKKRKLAVGDEWRLSFPISNSFFSSPTLCDLFNSHF